MKYRTDLIFLLDFLHTGYLSSFISQILHFLLWMVCVFLFLMAWQWKQRISELVRSVSRGKQLQLSHYAFEPHWLLKSNKIFWVALIVVIYNKNWRILYVVHHRVEQNLWSSWVYWWRFFLAWIAFAILSHQDTGEVHGTNGIWSIVPWIWGISGTVDSSAIKSSYKSVHDVINELIVWFMCSEALKALLKRLAFTCIVKAKKLK